MRSDMNDTDWKALLSAKEIISGLYRRALDPDRSQDPLLLKAWRALDRIEREASK